MTSSVTRPMPAGGKVLAIIPQTIEETFRLARGVIQSGLAPYSLTGKIRTADDTQRALSAVAIVIMAGAELGLPPMVSLRSFTVINGRPALYGDGLINVVRRSGMAKSLKMGWTYGGDWRLFVRAGRLPEPEGDTPEELAEDRKRIREQFEAWPEDERSGGYCEAERKDTGESKVMVFTVAEAKRAGLWQDQAEVMKDVWDNGQKVRRMAPNDSPWFRYRERMGGWRAAGYCLRDLFGDALGGITDEWEAREIAGVIDITPSDPPGISAPSPEEPAPPTPDEPELHNSDQPEGGKNEAVTDKVDEKSGDAENSSTDDEPQTPDEFLANLKYWLDGVQSFEALEETWSELDVHGELAHAPDHAAKALAMREEVIKRLDAAKSEVLPG